MKIQNDIGRKTEESIANFFNKRKYWAFIIPKKINGQPFDIIARKGNDIWFVDAKHVNEKRLSFPFDDVEPNQESSMKVANIVAGIEDKMGFVIKSDYYNDFFFLSYTKFKECKANGMKSVKILDLERLEDLVLNEDNNN